MSWRAAIGLLAAFALAVPVPAAPRERPLPHFREHLITRDVPGGYQVVAVDLNRDGAIDLIAVAQGMTDLVWFENPGWQRHVIASNIPSMINLSPWDYDGDGRPELILAHGFDMDPHKSRGTISMLHSGTDVTAPWTVYKVDALPTSHRIRWADIDGSGKKVFIDAPLVGPNAVAPDYRDRVPLVYYKPGEWERRLIDEQEEGILHGLTIVNWLHNGRDQILTAGFSGIALRALGTDGKWQRTAISKGDPAPWPKGGSSDVVPGHIGKERFLAAIEPWHGHQVVVYREGKTGWTREVIDTELQDAHTIATVDLNGDGVDEIIAGARGTHNVCLYAFDGRTWEKSVLDDKMPAAGCAIADLNGDGAPDIVCIGDGVLKWYENMGEWAGKPQGR
jgi:hypothetical protein